MNEYSIVSFLESLAEDDLEREMIKLISEGSTHDELLEKVLAIMRRKGQ